MTTISPLLTLLLLLMTSYGCQGFEWTSDVPDHSALYTCEDNSLDIPWSYTTGAGESVSTVKWFFQGQSRQKIAQYSRPQFFVTAPFANRVRRHRTSLAGITLSDVTASDNGTYWVEVSGRNDSRAVFKYNSTVVVQVLENETLMTSDEKLHAKLKPKAIYNKKTGQWLMVLTCGHFTFPGDPPFNMEWTTPSEVFPLQTSTAYKDGYFQLHVTSHGDYTCTIPQHAAADFCLSNATRHATVRVTKADARMAVMKGMQGQLQQVVTHLRAENTNLTTTLQALTDQCAPKYPCRPDDYTLLNDSRRRVGNEQGGDLCDKNLTQGWYRFRIDGEEAVLAQYCVSVGFCGTDKPLSLDIQRDVLPLVGKALAARACANSGATCCQWQVPLTVHNCGAFYVYNLQPAPICDMAYCVQRAVRDTPRNYFN